MSSKTEAIRTITETREEENRMDLYATELMGAKAYDVGGHYVGRVREFFYRNPRRPPQSRVRTNLFVARAIFQPLVAKHNQVCVGGSGENWS